MKVTGRNLWVVQVLGSLVRSDRDDARWALHVGLHCTGLCAWLGAAFG